MKKLPEKLEEVLKEVKLTVASSTWDCHGTLSYCTKRAKR